MIDIDSPPLAMLIPIAVVFIFPFIYSFFVDKLHLLKMNHIPKLFHRISITLFEERGQNDFRRLKRKGQS